MVTVVLPALVYQKIYVTQTAATGSHGTAQ